MTYWHIQLHPDNRDDFNIDIIQDILISKKIIGLGKWKKGESQIKQFKEQMSSGCIGEQRRMSDQP